MISAIETLDCANRVRRHYQLPRALEEALAAHYPDAQLTVQGFSRMVAGAKDHLSLAGEGFRAAGVKGEGRLVVTFLKPAGERPEALIGRFEAQLADAYGQPVVLVCRAPPLDGAAA